MPTLIDHRPAPPSGADRRARRRQELLTAAIEAIRTTGPSATMEQLANAGGVTKPILYRHFGDRDGLVNAIAEQYATDLITSVTAPLTSEASALELLHATVDAYIGFIERETNLYRFMVQHPPARGDAAGGRTSLVDRIAQEVALVATERLQAAGRPTEPAVAWAHGIVGLVHQAGDWWVDDQAMRREDLVDHLVNLLWDGLGA